MQTIYYHFRKHTTLQNGKNSARKQVPQGARLSEGGGVRSLFGQCPNRTCNFLSGASIRKASTSVSLSTCTSQVQAQVHWKHNAISINGPTLQSQHGSQSPWVHQAFVNIFAHRLFSRLTFIKSLSWNHIFAELVFPLFLDCFFAGHIFIHK